MSKASNGAAPERSYFEQQRELLVKDIGTSMEQVLQSLNKLNRSLEGVVSVGAEFATIESLWSHFEGIMGNRNEETDDQTVQGGEDDTVVQEAQQHSNNNNSGGR